MQKKPDLKVKKQAVKSEEKIHKGNPKKNKTKTPELPSEESDSELVEVVEPLMVKQYMQPLGLYGNRPPSKGTSESFLPKENDKEKQQTKK